MALAVDWLNLLQFWDFAATREWKPRQRHGNRLLEARHASYLSGELAGVASARFGLD